MAKNKLEVRGKVVAHNCSPKGQIEGVMIETEAGLVQLNFPKHGGRVIEVGKTIAVAVEPHDQEGDHPVYLALDADGAVEGRVTRFNYSRHGEVNGYHLQDGTFVHCKPHGARGAKVRIGDRISARGTRIVGEHATVVDTDAVTRRATR